MPSLIPMLRRQPRQPVLSVTGHRPHNLDSADVDTRLLALARQMLVEIRPESLLTGMAMGWDMACAEAALALGIPFTAAIPFPGQELRWPEAQRRRYHSLLSRAAVLSTVAEQYSTNAYFVRNRWLVDNSDALAALFDGRQTGGTYHCYSLAEKRGLPIFNYWEHWQAAGVEF